MLKASGEEAIEIQFEEFMEKMSAQPARGLASKRKLHRHCGLLRLIERVMLQDTCGQPRFIERLMLQDGQMLSDFKFQNCRASLSDVMSRPSLYVASASNSNEVSTACSKHVTGPDPYTPSHYYSTAHKEPLTW